jgi:hypothetical protein
MECMQKPLLQNTCLHHMVCIETRLLENTCLLHMGCCSCLVPNTLGSILDCMQCT